MNKFVSIAILISSFLMLNACSTLSSNQKAPTLTVEQTKGKTIFMEPVSPEKRIAYIEIKNTSGDADFNVLKQTISNNLNARGYRTTDNPERAWYFLQADVIKAGIMDENTKETLLNNQVKRAALGAGVGAIGGQIIHKRNSTAIGAGVGALAGLAYESLNHSSNYVVIADIRATQKKPKRKHGLFARKDEPNILGYALTKDDRVQDTRIAVTARQANINPQESKALVLAGLTESIAGIL